MKRRSGSVLLALVILASFADDVELTVRPLAVTGAHVAAIHSDSTVPPWAMRLLDSEGTTFEGAYGSRPNRDSVVAKAFAELHQEVLGSLATGDAADLWQAPSASSTLVIQHIRLQV